jgi:hypothetical protein
MNITPTAAAPIDRSAYVPARVRRQLADTTASYVNIAWDPSFVGADRASGFAFTARKDGSQAVRSAWAASDFARDRVHVELPRENAYEQAIVGQFTAAVARNEAALGQLVSNYALDARYAPRNGTFDFVFDRPGTDHDLRYVGLIDAAPAPIRDILESAKGFHEYF